MVTQLVSDRAGIGTRSLDFIVHVLSGLPPMVSFFLFPHSLSNDLLSLFSLSSTSKLEQHTWRFLSWTHSLVGRTSSEE